mmetsp:Transcript_20771/g.70390  ORF Transcript_20771/g.70390 Transcript_20771/m.70390 type:complete len:266 (-) Transcript_20771:267-1064(-)
MPRRRRWRRRSRSGSSASARGPGATRSFGGMTKNSTPSWRRRLRFSRRTRPSSASSTLPRCTVLAAPRRSSVNSRPRPRASTSQSRPSSPPCPGGPRRRTSSRRARRRSSAWAETRSNSTRFTFRTAGPTRRTGTAWPNAWKRAWWSRWACPTTASRPREPCTPRWRSAASPWPRTRSSSVRSTAFLRRTASCRRAKNWTSTSSPTRPYASASSLASLRARTARCRLALARASRRRTSPTTASRRCSRPWHPSARRTARRQPRLR